MENWKQVAPGEGRGFTRHAAVTPSDSTELFCDAIYVAGGGDVELVLVGGTTEILTTLPEFALFRAQIHKVAASTTATGIIAYWY